MNEGKLSPLARSRDLSFDLLRGGAVLYIVGYYHIQEIWMVHLPGGLSGWLARVALALFCFLSGYLLSQGKSIGNWAETGKFLTRRLLRIYPLYLLALIAFVSLGLCPKALFWPSALLINTLLNWSLLTLWFVSMIFLFYLVTPLFLHRASIRKTILLTTGILATLAILKNRLGWVDPRLFANFPAFAFGVLLTQEKSCREFFLLPKKSTVTASALVILVLIFLTSRKLPDDSHAADLLISLVWFFAALPGLFFSARHLTRWLPVTIVGFFSTASFVLYLCHRIFYHFGEQLLPLAGWHRQFYYVFLLLPMALVFSYALQKSYEKIFRQMS